MENKILYHLKEVENLIEGKVQYPIACEVDPSNRCQNDCRHCTTHEFRKSFHGDLDMGIYALLLDELKDFGTKAIIFTGGGEPLMHPEFEMMVKMAEMKEFELGLITNGILLEKIMDYVEKFKFVRVSLNATDKQTYKVIHNSNNFEKVVNNVREIVKRKGSTTVGMSYVVFKGMNDFQIGDAKRLAKYLKVDYVQFKPDETEDITIEENNDDRVISVNRYNIDSQLPCIIAGLVGIVAADGCIYYCCQCRDEKFKIGDLRKNSFAELWATTRNKMKVSCSIKTCRYMNYAEGYKKYRTEINNVIMEHKNFL